MRDCCQAIDAHFADQKARGLVASLERNGPPAETRLLLNGLINARVEGLSVLDIGSGIGVVAEQLLTAGARHAVLVDISKAYLETAARRLGNLGIAGRAEFRRGDIIELADELADADIVVLDKVICCYPDASALVQCSARKSIRFIAASYPRERWLVRLSIGFENLMRRLRTNPFRAFVHPVGSLEAELQANGFELRSVEQTYFWRCVLFARHNF